MVNIQKTQKDFEDHLKGIIKVLVTLSKLYDEGYEDIAIIIVVTIRVLVHDKTPNSISLLKHLNKKNIMFFDTSKDVADNQKLALPLLKNSSHIPSVLSISEQHPPWLPTSIFEHYIPLLDQSPSARKVSFDDWWNQTEILRIKNINRVTRGELILGIANKDGGVHIDEFVDPAVYNLARMPQKSGKIENGLLKYHVNSPAFATVRQITHEILMTLNTEYPDYFDGSYPNSLEPPD